MGGGVNIKRIFAKYVSLNIIGMLGLSLYILTDTFFVARGIGADGLTALNLAIPIYSFLNGIGLMIGMGGATRFSISKSKDVFTQSVYYVIIAACVFWTLGMFSKPISCLMGADSQTLEYTSVYLRTFLSFSPMFLFNNCIICFVRNDGNPKLPMIAMLNGYVRRCAGNRICTDYKYINAVIAFYKTKKYIFVYKAENKLEVVGGHIVFGNIIADNRIFIRDCNDCI